MGPRRPPVGIAVGINIGVKTTLLRIMTPTCRSTPHRFARQIRFTSSSTPTGPPTTRARLEWTFEEDNLLIKLRQQRVPFVQVPLVHRNAGAMSDRLTRLAKGARGEDIAAEARKARIPRSPKRHFVSEADKPRILRLVGVGWSMARVAKKLGVSANAVGDTWAQNRHSGDTAARTAHAPSPSHVRGPRTHYFTAEEDAVVVKLRAKGHTWARIGSDLPHRSMSSLRQRWQRVLARKAEPSGRLLTEASKLRSGYFHVAERIQLLELRQQGLPVRAIARRLGRTRTSVSDFNATMGLIELPADSADVMSTRIAQLLDELRAKAHKGPGGVSQMFQQRPRQRFTSAEIRTVEELLQDGTPSRYISQLLDRSPVVINTKARSLGMTMKPWTEEDKETLLTYREQGLEPPEIAIKLGRSEHSVRGNLRLPPLEVWKEK